MPRSLARWLVSDLRDDVRRAQDAAVGDRRVRVRDLQRRDRLALTHRKVAHRGARVLLGVQHDALLLTGEIDAGRSAEAEAVNPPVKSCRPELHPDLVGPDVAG